MNNADALSVCIVLIFLRYSEYLMISIKKLIQEYSNLMEWGSTAKSALLLGITFLAHSQYMLWAYYQISALGANQAHVNVAFILENKFNLNCLMALTFSLFLFVFSIRKRFPDSELCEHLAAQYYALTLIGFGYIIGTMTVATGVVLAGAPVVGFILFNRRAVILAFTVSLIGHGAISYITTLGEIPYAPIVINLQEANGSLSLFWLETMYFFAVPHLIILTVSAYHILSQWRKREEEVRLLSLTDALTHLSNRRSILADLNQEHERSDRYGNSFSVLLVDLDHFKQVNDTWGHPVGDLVLVAAAKALQDSVRKIDYVGRYGGEEFLIILPGTDSEGAFQLADRCRKQLEMIAIDIDQAEPVKITGSIGLYCNEHGRSISAEQMLHNADEALYKAKASGRNRVVRY